jgi:hypothetical protein
MCNYIQNQTSILKTYLLPASDSQDQYIWYIDMSLGTPLPSIDIKNCEVLTDAGLFREEVKLTRDGHNRYKMVYLTDLSRDITQQIKEDSFSEEITQIPPP